MELASHLDVSQVPSNAAATTSRKPLLLLTSLSITSVAKQLGKTANLQQQISTTTPQIRITRLSAQAERENVQLTTGCSIVPIIKQKNWKSWTVPSETSLFYSTVQKYRVCLCLCWCLYESFTCFHTLWGFFLVDFHILFFICLNSPVSLVLVFLKTLCAFIEPFRLEMTFKIIKSSH